MESEELAGAKKQGEIRGKKEEEDEKARNKGQNEKKERYSFYWKPPGLYICGIASERGRSTREELLDNSE